MNNRVELCCHTKMSKLQGINDAKEYIEEAMKRGYKEIAITDKNSTQAFLEASDYIRLYKNNEDFKIIYGAEMYLKENCDAEKKYSIYIYVKEQKGLKNLYRLISNAYTHVDYGYPVIYKDELDKNRGGLLFASIGKNSEVYRNIDNSNILDILKYYDFIGIEPNESDEKINKKINSICKKENKILIGTSECSFINKEDYRCNEILNFYKKSNKLEKGNYNYFQTTEELIDRFNYLDNSEEIVIENPKKISKQIEKINLIQVKSKCHEMKFEDITISRKCYDKAHELYGEKLPEEIKERIQVELHSIIENSFQTIYLIYSELVEYSNKLGYEVGHRGSVGCSLVAYLLGITNVDPIKYNLPFEIFMGKDYDREPDIDLNFSGKIRDKIFTYLQGKFGKDKIIWGGTVGTLSDRSLVDVANEYEKIFEIEDFKDKKEELNKLAGTKTTTGEHPGGIFIIPEDVDILDFCPTEIGDKGHMKTHIDYHSLWNHVLYKFDILSHDDPTMIHELEKETKISSKNINFEDKETLKLFLHGNDKNYKISINGIPEFGTEIVKKILEIAKPRNFNDLVCISALSHGTDTWNYNANTLIEKEGKKVDEVISNREDMYNYLVEKGINNKTAFDIVNFVRTGKASKGRSLWQHIRDRYIKYNDQWNAYKDIMKEHNVPKWYIESAEKISYMFPKSHAISYTINAFKIAWYKVHYPEAFYKVYFKIKSDLNIKDYYCKRQVKTELNRLYDKKERHKIDKEFDYDCSNNNRINDLELILEMFSRGVLKEKEEIQDNYNLINSRAISDYCRSIRYEFNTEELAVLVYRNKRMSIDEKIDKYDDLLKNYPDMEVIERINCKHYDSVKTMIKKEIQRLKILNKRLVQEGENCIWVWTEYNKSTLKYEHRSDLEHTFKTYKEALKDIQNYIKEYDDTISFSITKKYFDKRKGNIFAEYNVKDKKIKLINITESSDNFLDIDQIFINIPTPFQKGDILIQDSKSIRNAGDEGNIFVLEYLCTWKENLKEYLSLGNYDSSDMIGYGYYLVNEDTTKFVRDHKWDYDSFEYYDGELKGKYRILKDISSFVKGKIDLELFVHAYDFYKTEFKNDLPNFYTDEGLKLAGMTEMDILKVNHHQSEKIYNMSKDEQEEILQVYTCIYERLNKNEIKQIETDYDNEIYILTNSGKLYKTRKYDDELEFICEDIKKIFYLDGMNLYRITTQNIIVPIDNNKSWNNTDKYLNNNNCEYKKIETSKMHVVALTKGGNVRALCGGYPSLGIIPDNFIDVEDITIVEDENEIDMPYIYKNNEFVELYIE